MIGLIFRPRITQRKYVENDMQDRGGQPRFSGHHLLTAHLLKKNSKKKKKEKERKKQTRIGLYKVRCRTLDEQSSGKSNTKNKNRRFLFL